MKSRAASIIGWTCAILVALYNLFAAVMKFVPVTPDSEAAMMMKQLGVSMNMEHTLGVIELLIILLFLIPRTSTVGFVLIVGYMGGAFATNLTHGFTDMGTIISFVVVFVLLMISAWFRNPELITRLRKKHV